MSRLLHPKTKGSAFERIVAKQLGILFYNNEKVLLRSPTSGASCSPGDVVPNDKEFSEFFVKTKPSRESHPAGYFPFVIENKHHKDLQLDKFIYENNGFLKSVWEKTYKEAESIGRMTILIVKSNHTHPTFITDEKTIEYLKLEIPQPYSRIDIIGINPINIWICRFDLLCETNPKGILL